MFSGASKAGLFRLGTWGTEIDPDLPQQPDDVQVTKHGVSTFYSRTLVAQLSALGIERIYRSGVSTQAVAQATVRDGHGRDFEMIVIDDCCCAHSAEEHANSIGSLALLGHTLRSGTVDFRSR